MHSKHNMLFINTRRLSATVRARIVSVLICCMIFSIYLYLRLYKPNQAEIRITTNVPGINSFKIKELGDGRLKKRCQYPLQTFQETVFAQFQRDNKESLFTWTNGGDKTIREKNVKTVMKLLEETKFNVTMKDMIVCDTAMFKELTITEVPRNGLHQHVGEGGAGFMVRSQSAFLTVCPVTDHFNGTYTVLCPVYGPCSNISILLKHINFSGYFGYTKVIEEYIWQQNDICDDEVYSFVKQLDKTNKPGYNENKSNIKIFDSEMMQHVSILPRVRGDLLGEMGHWFQYDKKWHWLGNRGEILPLTNNKTMCKCYSKFKRVYLIGASHQGINTNCLNHLCGVNNIEKVDANFHDIVIRKTKMLLSYAQNDTNNQYALVLMFGSWDLTEHSPRLLIDNYLSNFTMELNESYAQQRHLYKNVKLLVIGSPSLPDDLPDGSRRVKRNNWVSAAFTHKLKQHMASLDVEFIDHFSFTFPLYWYSCAWPKSVNHHYAMWLPQPRNLCTGRVGKAFMTLLTSKLCPDIEMY